jgi:glycosyltransferase involved in cell wall biosynthesis
MLSVIIITKNEAHNISDCLESVSWVSEIIVVDSGSSDETVSICEKYGAHVFYNQWVGFGSQKNHALSLAKQPWILSIDADERVSPALREEIERALSSPSNCFAWKIPRLSSFCGQYIYHSGWWPDHVTRLFHRDHARFTDDAVHERVIVNGITGILKEHLIHESILNFEQLLAKMNQYTTTGASMMNDKKISSSLFKALIHGLWAFIRTYIIKRGFLDGKYGFILAVITAESAYYRYLKLMFLKRNTNARHNSHR